MTSPSPAAAREAPPRVAPAPPSPIARRLVALTPVWVSLIVFAANRTYFHPMFTRPPEILGIPLGMVMAGIATILMLLGALLVWDARSRFVEILGLFLFTIPATLLLVVGPGLILVIQNLG